jgi:hypothetical protein
LRELALVIAGVKPALLRGIVRTDDGHLRLGSLEIDDLVTTMAAAGLSVRLDQTSEPFHVAGRPLRLVVARDAKVAAEVGNLAEQQWRHTRSCTEPELVLALGSYLGYPRSGSEALLGMRPRLLDDAFLPHLSELERSFVTCVFAGDELGQAEALRHVRISANAFATTFPELVGVSER